MTSLSIAQQVPLAQLTTLELGGHAQHFVRVNDQRTLHDALHWADEQALPVSVLGGGSNVVISDGGVAGLLLHMALRGIQTLDAADGRVLVTAEAGEPWDELVALAVERDLAGVECLSGIPGLVGATPIQNVGAYGQEVADTIERVEVFDRQLQSMRSLPASECGFRYRDSAFKHAPGRYIVLAVTFALVRAGKPSLRYAELTRALGTPAGGNRPSLAQVRQTVIALRRAKSMVLDANDENRRSAGSFFTNPIVSTEQAAEVVTKAQALGVAQSAEDVPRYPQDDGRVKLAAGWLIERAGVKKGERLGQVGVSSRHALALVHHGQGSTSELIALAKHVRSSVQRAFGVTLEPEPVFMGFDTPPL
jgi:UDP-N-acetylmuramate dehydrogenase